MSRHGHGPGVTMSDVTIWVAARERIEAEIANNVHIANAQRAGQWTFNRLEDFYATIARSLAGSPCDCFYQDALIPAFWEKAEAIFMEEDPWLD